MLTVKEAKDIVITLEAQLEEAKKSEARKRNVDSLRAAGRHVYNVGVNLELARTVLHSVQMQELTALSDEDLLSRLKSARSYAYEATMGDYSMGSINQARAQVERALEAFKLRGVDASGMGW